ncbi:MAG: mechanosensitive ion channel family protein [Cyanobacteria bacterium J06632_22]
MSVELLDTTILDNAVSDYLLAVIIFVTGIVLTQIVRWSVLGRLKSWAKRSSTDLDDRLLHLIERPILRLLYLGGFFIGVSNLSLHAILHDTVRVGCVVLSTVLVIQLVGSLVEYALRLYWVKRSGSETLGKSLDALVPAIRVVIWGIGVVFLLDNLGFDVSAVVASLGIGGIAVALAAQGILGDLFSYFSILLDRPFELGDFVVIGDLVGTVEHVGIKTTRLRSLTGEELIAANTDLTASRIQNFKRMARRRIVFSLGVTYETAQDNMAAIPGLIQQAIDETPGVSFDRAHFSAFGDFSLDYEVVYYVESREYMDYMDAQQHINLAIKQSFEARQIDFAYPTQVLYLNKSNSEPGAASNGHGQRDSLAGNSYVEAS